VVLWSIEDHITAAATDPKSGGSINKTADSPTVGPRGIYSGHEDTVEDVAFCPSRYLLTLLSSLVFMCFFLIEVAILILLFTL